MIPTFLKNFYKRHNLRPIESTWLLYVHIVGAFGLMYAFYRYDIIFKVQSIIM